MSEDPAPPVLVRVVRNGIVESVHRGHVAVCRPDGRLAAALGDPAWPTYVRSAVKPFQAMATLELLDAAGCELDTDGLAIACASHVGSGDHQIEAARLLAMAGLDESALRCPPALPSDLPTLLAQRMPQSLAHNCSGKHAAFLLAHTVTGGDPARYLDLETPLQRRVREHLVQVTGTEPSGVGVDGCGAPAWVLPLRGLATAFARLAAGTTPALARIRSAMTARPHLVGGEDTKDTRLMRSDGRVVAKRGAEAVLGVGFARHDACIGIAVKVADGRGRADGPVAATLLAALGVALPEADRRPAILGGSRPHGYLAVDGAVAALAQAARG